MNSSDNHRRTNNTMAKIKSTMGQIMIYKTVHRKLKIEKHEPHKKIRVNVGSAEGLAVPVALVTPIVLQLNNTNII